MSKLTILLAVPLLLAMSEPGGCSTKRNETTWHGIPGKASCAWTEGNDGHQDQIGTCILNNVSYSCVFDATENHVECARTTPVFPAEK